MLLFKNPQLISHHLSIIGWDPNSFAPAPDSITPNLSLYMVGWPFYGSFLRHQVVYWLIHTFVIFQFCGWKVPHGSGWANQGGGRPVLLLEARGAAICVLAFTSFQRLPLFLGPFIFKASNGQPVFLTCIWHWPLLPSCDYMGPTG